MSQYVYRTCSKNRVGFKNSKILKDTLEYSCEIIKLIKKSPKREATLKRIKDEIGDDINGVKTLCPTRWTVKANLYAGA